MRTDELDFDLPPELIAQMPAPRREGSRLMRYRRGDRTVDHRQFSDLPALLRAGDVLVFNNARVLPARFILRKSTGGNVEGLFLEELEPGRWRVLLKNAGAAQPLHFKNDPAVSVAIESRGEEGEHVIVLSSTESAAALLGRLGRMPLPPYIKRGRLDDPRDELDRDRYQTVFATQPGAIAAPTAALHFSDELLEAIEKKGVQRVFVTLNVGQGTFKPVTAQELEDHQMHSESYTLDEAAAEALNHAKHRRNRIIAVGTTAARVLESQPGETFEPRRATTDIFIRSPYAWKHVQGLITNFHLPRSTLIALVAALIGLDEQKRLYRLAIENGYRFFSYGDSMFVE